MSREQARYPVRRGRRRASDIPISCPPEHLQSLLSRLRSNDEQALQELYTRLTPLMLGVLASYRRDPALYEHLHSQVYVEFYRLILQFDPARHVNFFVYLDCTLRGALRSCARRHRKIAWREPPISSLPPQGSRDDPTARGATAESLQQRLQEGTDEQALWDDAESAILDRLTIQQAVDALSPRRRQVLVLWAKGYNGPEIAALLGISEAACRQALHRALADVRRALDENQ